jgi:hypothetical protein
MATIATSTQPAVLEGSAQCPAEALGLVDVLVEELYLTRQLAWRQARELGVLRREHRHLADRYHHALDELRVRQRRGREA